MLGRSPVVQENLLCRGGPERSLPPRPPAGTCMCIHWVCVYVCVCVRVHAVVCVCVCVCGGGGGGGGGRCVLCAWGKESGHLC